MGDAQNTLLLRGWSYWTRLLGVFMIQNFKISMVFCISKQLESDPNSPKQLESDPLVSGDFYWIRCNPLISNIFFDFLAKSI